MRSLFNQPKPRRFAHRYQYIDERKERMRLLKEQAGTKRDNPTDERHDGEWQQRLHQAFTGSLRERNRRRRSTLTAAWLWAALATVAATLALLTLYAAA